jgi:signal transduction histidine kinase
MRRQRSLRFELTVAFAGLAGVAVLGAALAANALVTRTVWSSLDARLAEEAETLATLRTLEPRDLEHAVAAIGGETDLGPGKYILVIAPDGRIVSSLGPVPKFLRPPNGMPQVDREGVIAHAPSGTRTAIVEPEGGGRVLIGVRVASSLGAVRHARRRIAGIASALVVTLAALAWAITTRATRELDRVAAELETLEIATLDRRLEMRRTTEVDRLVAVLNRMLARLESATSHLQRFAADAAHELRTPIAALRARLEVSLAPGRPPSSYRDDLLDALEQTERVELLAENLLALSRVEADSRDQDRPVDLARLAREVGDSMEPIAQEQHRRFVVHAASTVPVLGAPELLKRLMVNLLDNAFRHTPADAPIELAVVADDGRAWIRARDEGPGIPTAQQAHLFERFYRGSDSGGGSGLGLALCREIVARHRGDIQLASAPGIGTTVTVTLPLMSEMPAA